MGIFEALPGNTAHINSALSFWWVWLPLSIFLFLLTLQHLKLEKAMCSCSVSPEFCNVGNFLCSIMFSTKGEYLILLHSVKQVHASVCLWSEISQLLPEMKFDVFLSCNSTSKSKVNLSPISSYIAWALTYFLIHVFILICSFLGAS